jgi:hypothetical protein
MKQGEYKSTVIIGASMLGIGIATCLDKDSVVIEPSNGVGNEFIRSFKIPKKSYTPVTGIGKQLQQELIQRNVMDDEGMLHLQGIMPVLMKYITEKKLDVRMQTNIVKVEHSDGKFLVHCYDASGFKVFITDRVVDTTISCASKPERFIAKGKRLNMMISRLPNKDQDNCEKSLDYTIQQGRFASEIFLKYSLDLNDDWIKARNKLFQFWLNRPDYLQPSAFVTHADEFDMEYNEPHYQIYSNWDWYPSAYYSHPLEAMEEGYNLVLGGDKLCV